MLNENTANRSAVNDAISQIAPHEKPAVSQVSHYQVFTTFMLKVLTGLLASQTQALCGVITISTVLVQELDPSN